MQSVHISVGSCNDKFQKAQTHFYRVQLASFFDLAEVVILSSWSPSVFANEYRSIKNTLHTGVLALDYDEGRPTLAEMIDTLKRENIRHVIATTQSHDKPKKGVVCDRFRVIIDTTNNPSTNKDQYHAQIKHFYRRWPEPDKSCKDPSRFYFPCREVVSVYDGDPVSWPKPPSMDSINSKLQLQRHRKITRSKAGVLPRRVDRFINNGEYKDSRRLESYYASAELARCGWQFDQVHAAVFNAPYTRSGLSDTDINDLTRQITNGFNAGSKDVRKEK
jgi:hypothetical protein